MPEEVKKLKCFWCGRRYVDLIGHTKRQHKGLSPRSYDYNKAEKLKPGFQVRRLKLGFQVMNLPVSKDIFEAINGIGAKRTKKIEELMTKNISKIELWLLKHTPITRKILGYSFKIEVMDVRSNEIMHENIALLKNNKEIDYFDFIVTKDEPVVDLWSIIPKRKPPTAEWNVKKD